MNKINFSKLNILIKGIYKFFLFLMCGLFFASNSFADAVRNNLQDCPLDINGGPLIKRLGTVDAGLVESSLITLHSAVYRLDSIRRTHSGKGKPFLQFINLESGIVLPPFGFGYDFGSAVVIDSVVYVTATKNNEEVEIFSSKDLTRWTSWTILRKSKYKIFNTSLVKAENRYVLMFEISEPLDEAGVPFTARFAISENLKDWLITTPQMTYSKERYTAPHKLVFQNGWFYNFYLEAFSRGVAPEKKMHYETYVVRSKNLVDWEQSKVNPVMKALPAEDKLIFNDSLSSFKRALVKRALDINNSDIDFIEHMQKLLIVYSWGDQMGNEFLAYAEYQCPLSNFLAALYPE